MKLEIRWGTKTLKSIRLEGELVTVGSTPENQLHLEHESVAALHAILLKDGDGYLISDQGSKNGTTVNREKIDEARIEDGDVIRIGEFLILCSDSSKGAVPMASQAGSVQRAREEVSAGREEAAAPAAAPVALEGGGHAWGTEESRPIPPEGLVGITGGSRPASLDSVSGGGQGRQALWMAGAAAVSVGCLGAGAFLVSGLLNREASNELASPAGPKELVEADGKSEASSQPESEVKPADVEPKPDPEGILDVDLWGLLAGGEVPRAGSIVRFQAAYQFPTRDSALVRVSLRPVADGGHGSVSVVFTRAAETWFSDYWQGCPVEVEAKFLVARDRTAKPGVPGSASRELVFEGRRIHRLGNRDSLITLKGREKPVRDCAKVKREWESGAKSGGMNPLTLVGLYDGYVVEGGPDSGCVVRFSKLFYGSDDAEARGKLLEPAARAFLDSLKPGDEVEAHVMPTAREKDHVLLALRRLDAADQRFAFADQAVGPASDPERVIDRDLNTMLSGGELPLPGSMVRFRGVFSYCTEENGGVRVDVEPSKQGVSGEAEVMFAGASKPWFGDYINECEVEVVGKLLKEDSGDLEFEGVRIHRPANRDSLITQQGREKPAVDLTNQKLLWETGVRAGATRPLAVAASYVAHFPSAASQSVGVVKLGKMFRKSKDLEVRAHFPDGPAKTFLESLEVGDEVVAKVLPSAREGEYFLVSMGRMDEPDKNFHFAANTAGEPGGTGRNRILELGNVLAGGQLPMPGTLIRLRGEFDYCTTEKGGVRVDVELPASLGGRDACISFPGGSKPWFSDYRSDSKVEVVGKLRKQNSRGDFSFEGVSIYRLGNRDSLVTNKGRAKAVKDWSTEKDAWGNVRRSRNKAGATLSGLFAAIGAGSGDYVAELELENLFCEYSDLKISIRSLNAAQNAFLGGLGPGDELLAKVQKDEGYRTDWELVWLARVDDPMNGVTFQTGGPGSRLIPRSGKDGSTGDNKKPFWEDPDYRPPATPRPL